MFVDHLHRNAGPSPLFTHYDEAAGSRVELSGRTFANWVDKTANLLEDLGTDPGETVHVELLTSAPGHWVTAVWVAGCWQRGCPVIESAAGAELAVVGPESQVRGSSTVMCSLHPLGLGLPQLPPGCVDYADVLAQPDDHLSEPVAPDEVAWLPHITHEEVARTPVRESRRLFADPGPGWSTVQDLLVAPVLGGGSTVVVTGASSERLQQIADEERTGSGS